MNKNKGRNFLIGLAVIFIATKIYMSGILNEYGYMLVGQPTTQQLANGDDVVRGPAADFVDLVVDMITIIGYVFGIVVGGIYETVRDLIGAAGDGARKAKDRIDDVNEEEDSSDEADTVEPDDPAPDKLDDPLLIIAKAVQSNSQAIAEMRNLLLPAVVSQKEATENAVVEVNE